MVVIMKNPPAFPPMHDPNTHEFGMTLRDYFAAKAMEAFMSGWISREIYPETDMVIAEHAYSMADAMLAAREEA
jgi:hypothetical protein